LLVFPKQTSAWLHTGTDHTWEADTFLLFFSLLKKEELDRFAKPVEEESKKGFFHKKNIVHRILNLNQHSFSDEQIEKWKLDYSVFDKSIVIVWRPNNNGANNRMGDCVLVFDNDEVEKYSALFGLLETDNSIFKNVSDFQSGGT